MVHNNGMKNILISAWGWYGAFALLGAFALNSFSILGADSIIYQLLNLSGASGIMAISLWRKTYPPAALNAVWSLVALVVLIRILF